jgi:hypothetical protein
MRAFPLDRSLAFSLLALLATSVQAHDGHGLPGVHWHATDVLGFIGLAAVVAAAIWLGRK